jgi:hypothetical protein
LQERARAVATTECLETRCPVLLDGQRASAPDLNPIEMFRGIMKKRSRTVPRECFGGLRSAIRDLPSAIAQETIDAFVQDVRYRRGTVTAADRRSVPDSIDPLPRPRRTH